MYTIYTIYILYILYILYTYGIYYVYSIYTIYLHYYIIYTHYMIYLCLYHNTMHRFTATGRVVAIIQELRAAFDSLLQRKFDEPDTEIAGEPVIELACQLLNTQAQY